MIFFKAELSDEEFEEMKKQELKDIDNEFKSLVEDDEFVPGEFEKGADAIQLTRDLSDCQVSCDIKPVFKHSLTNRLPRNVIDPECTVEEPGELSFILSQCTTVCEPQVLAETEYTDEEKDLIHFLERRMNENYEVQVTRDNIERYINDRAIKEYRKKILMEFFGSADYVRGSDATEYENEGEIINVRDKTFKIAKR